MKTRFGSQRVILGFLIHLKKSERPVDALAVKLLEKGESLTHSLIYNLKSRDASASKNLNGTKAPLPRP